MNRLKSALQKTWRKRRMAELCARLRLENGMSVIDLGGTEEVWRYVDLQLRVTILNLPGACGPSNGSGRSEIRHVAGDACSAPFPDRSFDVAFSNSVIEHIPLARHPSFAGNVMRLAPSWWVQTPLLQFPIEAHCNLPLWWSYPEPIKRRWIEHWRKSGNAFLADQMASTLGMGGDYYIGLFKDCSVYVEKSCGFPKSISLYACNP